MRNYNIPDRLMKLFDSELPGVVLIVLEGELDNWFKSTAIDINNRIDGDPWYKLYNVRALTTELKNKTEAFTKYLQKVGLKVIVNDEITRCLFSRKMMNIPLEDMGMIMDCLSDTVFEEVTIQLWDQRAMVFFNKNMIINRFSVNQFPPILVGPYLNNPPYIVKKEAKVHISKVLYNANKLFKDKLKEPELLGFIRDIIMDRVEAVKML